MHLETWQHRPISVSRSKQTSNPVEARIMTIIERRLEEMGFVLPPQAPLPAGMVLPFRPVRVVGERAVVSGHGPQTPDGNLTPLRGKVGREIGAHEAGELARLVALAMLGSLARALGDLDRISAWVRVFGMINVAPSFQQLSPVMNGFSDLILELYGPDIGSHARTVVGVSELPFNLPIEIEAELQVRS